MSLLKRTIEAFPRGRTTEELFILLDVDFDRDKRLAILSELDHLTKGGLVRKGQDGRWRPMVRRGLAAMGPGQKPSHEVLAGEDPDSLVAAVAQFQEVPEEIDTPAEDAPLTDIDPGPLLSYWRAALRSDPRGAITQAEDRHGVDWHLLTGAGPLVPGERSHLKLLVLLDHLSDGFRHALIRREANDKSLALGWPIAVCRRHGVPAITPVGLRAAKWQRTTSHLEIIVEVDNVAVNPDWLKLAAAASSWTESGLRRAFESMNGFGLASEEFLVRLKETAAGTFHGAVSGRQLSFEIDPGDTGIYDIAGLFLPTDTSFTAGAVQDLDEIATWPLDRLKSTAIAPALGLKSDQSARTMSGLNTSPLNAEQIEAVRNACQAPLTVITGPPGTGKSQAIVAMVASVLAAEGSVLVASRNHQALDAVEDRLLHLAPDTEFLVRTLDPEREVDCSFADVLAALVNSPAWRIPPPDEELRSKLASLVVMRNRALELGRRRNEVQCEIAELLERIEVREQFDSNGDLIAGYDRAAERTRWTRLVAWFVRIVSRRALSGESATTKEYAREVGAPNAVLRARLDDLRIEVEKLGVPDDAVELTAEIASLASTVLPNVLSRRSVLNETERLSLAAAKDGFQLLAQRDQSIPPDLASATLAHRPLWLASILGTPKRVPLAAGLFDLVIFDEASQCDIASALPLFARAKRAVVVGDNRQLSVFSQIGIAQDRNLMQAHGLPVEKMGRFAQSQLSLFEFASRVPNVPRVFLCDQYRSSGEIVDYISRHFYGGRLRAAHDPKVMNPPPGTKPGIAWTHVASPRTGMQENVNQNEVEAIATYLRKLLVDQDYDGSVGVISPFRPQVAAMWEALRSQLPNEVLGRSGLRVGTVDSFQGQERDLILFSPCVGASSAQSAVVFLQKDYRRLNVAISRAKAVAHIFGDLDYARSGKIRALVSLAAFATEPRTRSGDGAFDSAWERRVYHALKERGLAPIPQYEIVGRRLDFALFGRDDVKLDLEIDGRQWHSDMDGRRKVADHWRDHQLKSLGWRVRRFWVDELSKDMEACLDLIERDLS